MEDFSYRKLRGRIVEKCGTITALAEAVGVSKVTATNKLRGHTEFTKSDIEAWSEILDIRVEEIGDYFFT